MVVATRLAFGTLILGTLALHQISSRAQAPSGPVISTNLPEILTAIGPWEARIRVTVEQGRVIAAQAIHDGSTAPPGGVPLIEANSEAYVRQWTFPAASSGSFVTTLRVSRDEKSIPCRNDGNVSVVARPPILMEFTATPFRFCDPTTKMNRDPPITVRAIVGYVRCDCRGRPPIEGATIRITSASLERQVRSDDRGYFRMGDVPPGTYAATIEAGGHYGLEMQVTVSGSERAGSMDVRLERQPPAPPLPPGPQAVVASARLAAYPAAARASGLEGIVRMRLSSEYGAVVDYDVDSAVPDLARAAEENVRTWKFRFVDVPVLLVTYTYRLMPGDCGPDQEPTVTMRFPHVVEVTAKRPIKCQAF